MFWLRCTPWWQKCLRPVVCDRGQRRIGYLLTKEELLWSHLLFSESKDEPTEFELFFRTRVCRVQIHLAREA